MQRLKLFFKKWGLRGQLQTIDEQVERLKDNLIELERTLTLLQAAETGIEPGPDAPAALMRVQYHIVQVTDAMKRSTSHLTEFKRLQAMLEGLLAAMDLDRLVNQSNRLSGPTIDRIMASSDR
jgi:phage shock protein A